MVIQNQIKRTLSQRRNIEYIQDLLKGNPEWTRSKVALEACDYFGFSDPQGRPQSSSCLKGLRELESAGHIKLPESQTTPGKKFPRRASSAVLPATNVPYKAADVSALRLILVRTQEEMQIWNELMISGHPRGAGPLVGRQLRYLVFSDHGWLGGFGFAAAALHLGARDRWIGWDTQTRRENLHSVVCMSRFLICPEIHCRNLASKLLGMCMKMMPADFEDCYGYRPVLVESFADEHYSGTSYRAANWRWVGKTCGRGRQDRHRDVAQSVKDIYVYPLDKDFRVCLGVEADSGLSPLTPWAGLDCISWAEQEFGNAQLGDKRLSRRLVQIARAKALTPECSFTGATRGESAAVKAYYRLIDKPDDDLDVSMENLLHSHREQTLRRIEGQQTVLCVQDGTDLNFNGLDECEGLGIIGNNQTGAGSRGLHMHSTLAISTDGLVLGVLRAECSAPQPKKDKTPASEIPIEEKKTFSWIKGFRDCLEIKRQIPHTSLISVMDREADFFELFDEQQRNPGVQIIVRAKHDRKTSGLSGLFDSVREEPVQGKKRVHIPRQSARAKKSKQKARPKRPGRTAELSFRSKEIELLPPAYLNGFNPISVRMVHVVEEEPPEGAKPIEWFLLTSLAVNSLEDAEKCVQYYRFRWRIEDWHRVLKSGCRTEDIAHHTAERLKRAIAINLVIAWRIMLMTLLGRDEQDHAPEELFSDIEIDVLDAFAKKRNLAAPTTVKLAVHLMGRLGGWLGRKKDYEHPGHQLLWDGYRTLSCMCAGFALALSLRGPP
ncbi:MAG: IS4 family transposase [Gammaproteobacteria bacterium]|nr:IS4 family transposase [Gammaproteobacteria bacterium]